VAGSEPLVVPQAPLIKSPTHPNPDTVYTSNAVTFTWKQPRDDPAKVAAYDWVIDQNPDTVPTGLTPALATTTAYLGERRHLVSHVRAMSDQMSMTRPPQDPWTRPRRRRRLWTCVTTRLVSRDRDGDAADPNGAATAWVQMTAFWRLHRPLVLSADSPGTTVYAHIMSAIADRSRPQSRSTGLAKLHVAAGKPGTWLPR
jgi:hypothetical protein